VVAVAKGLDEREYAGCAPRSRSTNRRRCPLRRMSTPRPVVKRPGSNLSTPTIWSPLSNVPGSPSPGRDRSPSNCCTGKAERPPGRARAWCSTQLHGHCCLHEDSGPDRMASEASATLGQDVRRPNRHRANYRVPPRWLTWRVRSYLPRRAASGDAATCARVRRSSSGRVCGRDSS
jgi:hypothetical protein